MISFKTATYTFVVLITIGILMHFFSVQSVLLIVAYITCVVAIALTMVVIKMNETLNWLKEPENERKKILGLLALNLLAGSILLFITASGQGPFYEAIKPTVVEEKYILLNQYVGDITVNRHEYNNVLIFDVQPLNKSLDPHQLYFAKEHVKRFDLNDGDIIVCTWLVQITGEKRITSVVNLDIYNQIYVFELNDINT